MSAFSAFGIEVGSTDVSSTSLGNSGFLVSSSNSVGSMRSMASMSGLLSAEAGIGMVKLSTEGGFTQGQDIACTSPVDISNSPNTRLSSTREHHSLDRNGTILAFGAHPAKNERELKLLLGNSHAKVRSGAAVSQGELERAKSRSRVELDIVLHQETFVQGGYVNGTAKIRIRKPSKKQSPVHVSGGKIRLVGFESVQGLRHTFYHHSSLLYDVSTTSLSIHKTEADAEGFFEALSGVHEVLFSVPLPMMSDMGVPKGHFDGVSGISVRCIVLLTMKVKDVDSNRRSIAHFYRNCEVWPRLDPSTVLAPAPRPIFAKSAKTLFMGGEGQVQLQASLHRICWVAGQRCYVNFEVLNESTKHVKRAVLTLLRSVITYMPDARLHAGRTTTDVDACQTSTNRKVIAESVLEMGDSISRGHASSKGWWAGVAPSQHACFSHFIELPSDALTIPRTRLVEVAYTLCVSLSAGALSSDVNTTLPIRIINFLSLDPPSSRCNIIPEIMTSATNVDTMKRYKLCDEPAQLQTSMPLVLFMVNDTSPSKDKGERSSEHQCCEEGFHIRDTSLDDTSLLEDTDEIIQYTLSSYQGDEYGEAKAPLAFADLYRQDTDLKEDDESRTSPTQDHFYELPPNKQKPRRSSFAARVHEKMLARAALSESPAPDTSLCIGAHDMLQSNDLGSPITIGPVTPAFTADSIIPSQHINSALRGPRVQTSLPSGINTSSSSISIQHESSILSMPPAAVSSDSPKIDTSMPFTSAKHDDELHAKTPTQMQISALPPVFDDPNSCVSSYAQVQVTPGNIISSTKLSPSPIRRNTVTSQAARQEPTEVEASRNSASAPASRRNSVVVPARSVKDKIKELEEKLKRGDV